MHALHDTLIDTMLCADDDNPQVVPVDLPTDTQAATAAAQQPNASEAVEEGTALSSDADNTDADMSGFQAAVRASPVQQPTHELPQQSQVLHVCLGPLPDVHASCKAFYFLRNEPGKLSPEDMEQQLDCGVLSEGPSLRMLQQVRTDASLYANAGC